MTAVRRNASIARTTGGLLGATAAGLYMLRKKRSLLSFRYIFGTFGGSLIGSWLFVPVGVVWSTSVINRVENPQHLAGILQEAQKARMRSQLPRGGAQPFPRQGAQDQRSSSQSSMDPANQSMSSSYPPAPTPPPTRTSARSKGAQTNQWGDEINAPEMPSYTSDTPSPPPSNPYSTTPESSSTAKAEQSNGNQQEQSRWAQLRGQRQVQESSWDRLRQENAREAYNKQAASGQGRPDQVAFSQGPDYAGQSGRELADPDFGKGYSPDRSQAQREYERSFERERRGADG
jgi:hypothetical protein